MTDEFILVTPHDALEFNDVYRNTTGSAGYLACNNIYNRVVLNEWNEINAFPDLATHWECLDGARRWRFHLNQAARWHDGTPVTAHDVVYTHTHAKEMGYTGGRFMRDVDQIVEVNAHTVDYHLSKPNSGFLVLLGNFIFTHILPAHLYEGTDWATNSYNFKPVGSGPFRLVDWVPGDKIVMEAVKDHWGPRPEIDRFIIKIVPDRDECIRMIADGRAHYHPQDTLTKDRLHLLEGATANIELKKDPGPGMALLDFNHRHELWQDPRVRKAIGHAIDRSKIAEITEEGVSQAWPHYLLGSTEWAFNSEAKAPEYDPQKARELLADAGVAHQLADRELTLYYMELFDGHRPLADIIKQQLREVGVHVNVTGLPSPQWAKTVNSDHDFDLVIVGGALTPDPEITSPKYASDGDGNFAGHHNPDVDAAYEAARAATTLTERGAHYRTLQEVWARDVEWVPLLWYGTYFARSADMFGWSDELAYSVPWWHFGRIRPVK